VAKGKQTLSKAMSIATATQVFYTTIDSPIGPLFMTMEDDQLTNICMNQQKREVEVQPEWEQDQRHFREVAKQLREYFAGKRREFDFPLRLDGTAFQCSVWNELRKIPFGETISYAELARRIQNPKAVRAVGLANGQNPIPVVVPCHRVIGSNGSLTGFGGGIEKKKLLLDLERRSPKPASGSRG
jgi:methylated-DNA-[protein]-cysteine S-methyltransferase